MSKIVKIFPKISERWSGTFLNSLIKHRRLIHLGTILTALICVFFTSCLELRTDFSELLPQKLPSVIALKEGVDRLGGSGLLIVGVESSSFKANKRFVEAFATKIKPWVGTKLRYFEYRFAEVKDFGERYGLHYLSLKQLDEVRDYLKEQTEKRWNNSVASSLGLDDEKTSTSSKSFEEILEDNSAGSSLGAILKYRDAYLSAHDGKVLAVALRPMSSSLSLGQSRDLVRDVEKVIADLKPQSFHPTLKTVLAGSVPQAIEEFETIRNDIVGTSLLLTALIFTALFIFFWSFRLIFVLCLNLIVAVIWTFALTKLHIGYLNTQTAFLGSLVAGTGINYGIILISRFIELRREGQSLEHSLSEALKNTLIPTFIASLATAASFLILLLASNQGLAQFGFIGSIGVLLCWVFAFTLLPLWLYELEIRSKKVHLYHNPIAVFLKPWGIKIGNGIIRYRHSLIFVIVALSAVGIFGFRKLAKEPLEYNFDNVKNKTSVTAETEAFRDRVYDAFPTSLTPSLAFADNEAEAKAICPEVRRLKRVLPEEKNVISSCTSYYDLLPEVPVNKTAQIEKFRAIHELLGDRRLKFSDDYDLLKGIREKMTEVPPKAGDLPEQILRRFREKDGRIGLFATINPDGKKPLNDARNLLAFTESLSPIHLQDPSKDIQVAGDSFVLADLLRGIQKEGPLLTGLAFLAVFIIGVVLTGGLQSGLIMAACLIFATWWMLSIQGFWGLKYNFFNFIALPLTFGIGIDYPVNVYLRSKHDPHLPYGKIFSTTGMAVWLCSLTTFIGYYTLIGASSQALAGFGRLAIIGEFTCLFAALVVMPIVLECGIL